MYYWKAFKYFSKDKQAKRRQGWSYEALSVHDRKSFFETTRKTEVTLVFLHTGQDILWVQLLKTGFNRIQSLVKYQCGCMLRCHIARVGTASHQSVLLKNKADKKPFPV